MLLPNGFRTLVTFSLRPGIFLREREVQPPPIDGGGPIDTTTMRNLTWRTKAAKTLKDLGELVIQAQYDPFVYSQMQADVNVPQAIIVTFPDGATLQFYGYIDKFTPPSNKEGEFPVAEVRVCATNRNPTATVAPQVIGGDTNPVVTAGANVGLLAL